MAQVIQETNESNEDAVLPSAFDANTDFESMTDDEIREAVRNEQAANTQTMSLDRVIAAGCIYQVMPENYKMELLDTKHPNSNTPEFIRWLAGRSSAPFGLTQQFATLQSDGTSFRAEQLMTWPAFYEAQKFLEQICDWCFWRWSLWASKHGIVKPMKFDDMQYVDWSWPKMDELDENAHQDAVEKKLRNMTSTLQAEIGADWKSVLNQYKAEIEYCKANGLPHPSMQMISGGMREEYYNDTNE